MKSGNKDKLLGKWHKAKGKIKEAAGGCERRRYHTRDVDESVKNDLIVKS